MGTEYCPSRPHPISHVLALIPLFLGDPKLLRDAIRLAFLHGPGEWGQGLLLPLRYLLLHRKGMAEKRGADKRISSLSDCKPNNLYHYKKKRKKTCRNQDKYLLNIWIPKELGAQTQGFEDSTERMTFKKKNLKSTKPQLKCFDPINNTVRKTKSI